LEGRVIVEQITVEENLRAGALVAGDSNLRTDLDMVYDYFPVLKGLRGQTSGYLSGGEQQMLVIGRALMAHPKLMLVDEASLGLAPLLVDEIFRILKRINKEERVSILLVEQNARAALSLAQHGYVMDNGRIVLDDTGEKLRDNADIKEFYMGLGSVGEAKSYRNVKHYRRRKRWLS
jgi:branched-chain amino acid transport system ATP-binding protein